MIRNIICYVFEYTEKKFTLTPDKYKYVEKKLTFASSSIGLESEGNITGTMRNTCWNFSTQTDLVTSSVIYAASIS